MINIFWIMLRRCSSDDLKEEKEALRCVCEKMMVAKLNRKDAEDIIKNFNTIRDPGFEWVEG